MGSAPTLVIVAADCEKRFRVGARGLDLALFRGS